MANDPHNTTPPGDIREASVGFPDEGVTTSVDVEPLGGHLYRLRGVPLLVEGAAFMDVIEATAAADGSLTFARVVEPSGWRVFDFLLSGPFIASGKLEPILARADALGAHWERVFEGMLYICVPPGVPWDPTPELKG